MWTNLLTLWHQVCSNKYLQSHMLNVSLTGVEDESADTVAPIKQKGKGRKAHKGEFGRVTRKQYNCSPTNRGGEISQHCTTHGQAEKGKESQHPKEQGNQRYALGRSEHDSLSNSTVLMSHLLSSKSTSPHNAMKIWHPKHPIGRW